MVSSEMHTYVGQNSSSETPDGRYSFLNQFLFFSATNQLFNDRLSGKAGSSKFGKD
jgi:hypothetical protein